MPRLAQSGSVPQQSRATWESVCGGVSTLPKAQSGIPEPRLPLGCRPPQEPFIFHCFCFPRTIKPCKELFTLSYTSEPNYGWSCSVWVSVTSRAGPPGKVGGLSTLPRAQSGIPRQSWDLNLSYDWAPNHPKSHLFSIVFVFQKLFKHAKNGSHF